MEHITKEQMQKLKAGLDIISAARGVYYTKMLIHTGLVSDTLQLLAPAITIANRERVVDMFANISSTAQDLASGAMHRELDTKELIKTSQMLEDHVMKDTPLNITTWEQPTPSQATENTLNKLERIMSALTVAREEDNEMIYNAVHDLYNDIALREHIDVNNRFRRNLVRITEMFKAGLDKTAENILKFTAPS